MNSDFKLWNTLKVIIAVVPSFSLIMACLYYSVFFSNFEGLTLNILTLSDYFNKAVELIPLALFVIFGLMFALFMYPPKHEGESEEEHYNRIGGSKKTYENIDRVFLFSLFTILPAIIIFKFFTLTFREFVFFTPSMFMFYIIMFIRSIEKHFSPRLRDIVYTRISLLIFIGVFVASHNVMNNSLADAHRLREVGSENVALVDIIEAGYLKKENRELVLYDDAWVKIVSYNIEKPSEKSLGCSLGFKFSCPKGENQKSKTEEKRS